MLLPIAKSHHTLPTKKKNKWERETEKKRKVNEIFLCNFTFMESNNNGDDARAKVTKK